MIPTFIFQTWLFGLLSLGILGGAVWAGHEWQQRSWSWDPVRHESVFMPALGWNEDTAVLAAALALLLITFFGGSFVKTTLRLMRRGSAATETARLRQPDEVHQLKRPDGSTLHVECFGPVSATPIVLSHGWTLDLNEWDYLIQHLGSRFRLIVWDEPGLGRSTRPTNRDYSLENLASHLQAVLTLARGRPAILLGHSIGGMIVLTFCRLFRDELPSRVMGLVLTHTTPTDPVQTTSGASFYKAIEKPVLVPMMYLTIALSPLVWILNWLSYRNGSAHLSAMRSSFAGTETWGQIEFAARCQAKSPPAVVARGMLGMMHYDASSVLGQISVPSLVVSGDRDTTTKPEASDWMEAKIPTSQRVILTPAKHLGLLEHHKAYAAAVETFAHSCQGTAQSYQETPRTPSLLASGT